MSLSHAVLLLMLAAPAQSQTAAFARNMLAAHNAVRMRMKVPPLVWSDHLAATAQRWADTLAARGQFIHSPSSAYGENLFEIEGTIASSEQVVADWISESRNYDYRSNSCRGICGHYTQIVWRDTKELGCGVASRRGAQIWVCNYNPPGNWTGRRPY